MKKEEKNIAAHVENLLSDTIVSLGYQVWNVELLREGGQKYLRITIDKEDGIDIDDCEKVHRVIEPMIDEDDPIEDFYYLEVSSPGLERELKKDAHLDYCMGWDVELKFYAPIDGKKSLRGSLAGYDGDSISVSCGDERLSFPRKSVAQIKTVCDFDE